MVKHLEVLQRYLLTSMEKQAVIQDHCHRYRDHCNWILLGVGLGGGRGWAQLRISHVWVGTDS